MSWEKKLPQVVLVYNNDLGHEGSFGSTPADVLRTPVLDFQVRQKQAEGLAENTERHDKDMEKVANLGAARHLLPRTKWKNDNEARYSGDVHYLAKDQSGAGPYVKDKDGTLWNPKLVTRPISKARVSLRP